MDESTITDDDLAKFKKVMEWDTVIACPYCMGILYQNRDGTFTCYQCQHVIDRDDLERD